MKHAKTWIAVLLAAMLLTGILPTAALAEEDVWTGGTDVSTFTELQEALEDESVKSILITGDVEVPASAGPASQPLETHKPILVCEGAKFSLEPGAVMTSDVPQGQFAYEDSENTWAHVSEGMAAFFLWSDGESYFRAMYGSQPQDVSAILQSDEHGGLVLAVLRGDVELSGETSLMQLQIVDGSLTLKSGAALNVSGYLEVLGNLTVEETGTLSLGEYGAFVDGDVEFLGAEPELPENLGWSGEMRYTHLAACWDEDNQDYSGGFQITPYDEYELTFAMHVKEGGKWKYIPVTPTVSAPLAYGANSEGRMTLTAKDASWDSIYEITYSYNGLTYALPVYVELPQAGFYTGAQPSESTYLTHWDHSLSGQNSFYLCVRDDAWFMSDDYQLSRELVYTGDPEGEDQIRWEYVREGVWKITTSGGDFYADFQITVLREDGQLDDWFTTGLWIGAAQTLVYSDTILPGVSPYPEDPENLDRVYQESFRSFLRPALSLQAGSSKDLALYLLVYNSEDQRWICEYTGSEWAEGRGGVTVTGSENSALVRVTAGSRAGTAQLVRLDGTEVSPGEYRPIPGSTRGTPVTVAVTAVPTPPDSSGSSGSSSDNDGTYSISLPSRVVGGEISVRSRNVKEGSTVTVTATPKDGYTLSSLTVTNDRGNTVATSKAGDNQYTFTMPSSRVRIDASFVKTDSQTVPTPTPTPTSSSFTDVDSGAYYAEAVEWAVKQGITTGATSTTFNPYASCTRAQTVTFLWRAAGSPTPTSQQSPFSDVQPGSYYYNAVLWAVEQGITGGTTDTTFSPDATVTRVQTVVFLHRAAGSPAAAGSSSFTDVNPDAYYAAAVQWAAEQGITSGETSTTFNPYAGCTRAQIMTFLFRSVSP